jgi:3-hydroxymyristoyl/3-hydroxydecanoyl-(acyl carrier protein) dehydratase
MLIACQICVFLPISASSLNCEARLGETLSVRAGHPALPGHFPGRPIVPGVVILDMLIEDLRRQRPDLIVRGIRKLKFVRPLAPEECFRVDWAESRHGGMRFSAFVGDERLASGQVLLA